MSSLFVSTHSRPDADFYTELSHARASSDGSLYSKDFEAGYELDGVVDESESTIDDKSKPDRLKSLGIPGVLALALFAQTLKGFGPGLAKYLQEPVRHRGFKSLMLVTTRNSFATAILGLVCCSCGGKCFC